MGGGEGTSAMAGFDAFFAREYPRVLALTTVLCGTRSVAEELTQDAFVAAFRRWSTVASYDEPGAWVRRVAVNLATSTLRRRARELRALTRLSMRRETLPSGIDGDDEFWAVVRKLPARQAQCIALHYVEDRPVAAIASTLQISESTVRVHLHVARRFLAEQLGEQLEEDRT